MLYWGAFVHPLQLRSLSNSALAFNSEEKQTNLFMIECWMINLHCTLCSGGFLTVNGVLFSFALAAIISALVLFHCSGIWDRFGFFAILFFVIEASFSSELGLHTTKWVLSIKLYALCTVHCALIVLHQSQLAESLFEMFQRKIRVNCELKTLSGRYNARKCRIYSFIFPFYIFAFPCQSKFESHT